MYWKLTFQKIYFRPQTCKVVSKSVCTGSICSLVSYEFGINHSVLHTSSILKGPEGNSPLIELKKGFLSPSENPSNWSATFTFERQSQRSRQGSIDIGKLGSHSGSSIAAQQFPREKSKPKGEEHAPAARIISAGRRTIFYALTRLTHATAVLSHVRPLNYGISNVGGDTFLLRDSRNTSARGSAVFRVWTLGNWFAETPGPAIFTTVTA